MIRTRRSRPRRTGAFRCAVAVVLAAMVAVGVAACDSDDSSTPPDTTAPSTTTTGDSPDVDTTPIEDIDVSLTPIADVEFATGIAARPDDARLYVTQQRGQVVAVDIETGETETVLDIEDMVTASTEQGLIGLTFSPDGSHLYVHYSDLDGNTQIDEYAFDGDGLDTSSQRSVLSVEQPRHRNHKGGKIAFGPDGMLWVALGDGGGGGDPEGNGQNTSTLLGGLVRIDPSTGDTHTIPDDNPFVDGGGAPALWASGLRNPWQFSFDAQTGDLWIGDVGQSGWEEINFAPAPDRGRGANYGWNLREGTHEYAGEAPEGAVDPIFEYPYGETGCSVTGGMVYRGEAIPTLQGVYVYSDFCAEDLRALRVVSDGLETGSLSGGVSQVVAFGEGPDGELYFLSRADGLVRVDPA